MRLLLLPFVLCVLVSAAVAPRVASQDAPETKEQSPAAHKAADSETTHWSFQPLRRPDIPQTGRSEWVRNAIDAFVLERLEKEGIAPSPEADRATLIRRLYLDLLGLLPEPEEVRALELDNGEDAYERLVDRLFESPHYGERWAQHWLDMARYADSDGYEKDLPRPHAWRWRNWVIEAINRDMPFDQFTIEQLAGDLLPDATLEQNVATGFHRNTLTNREGGVDQEEYRVKAIVDRVSTTGTVWLGLTIGCCECHSHKYDPLTQREFYGMFAFFNAAKEIDIPAPLSHEIDAYETAKAVFDQEHTVLVAAQEQFEREQLSSRQAEWEAAYKPSDVAWTVLEPIEMSSAGGATLEKQTDGSILASGENPQRDTYTLVFDTQISGITAIRLEVLPDESLGGRGPGRTKHGNFVLSELKLAAAPQDDAEKSVAIELVDARADHAQKDYAVARAFDGDAKTGWAVAPHYGRQHVAVFELKQDISFDSSARLTLTLDQQHGSQHTLGRMRISVTTAERPVALDVTPDSIIRTLALPAEERSDEQKIELADFHRSIDPGLEKLRTAVEEHAKKEPKYPETKAPALAFNADAPQTHIHERGDFLRKGDAVEPHTPAVLPAMVPRNDSPDRLDLARWLVDPKNPLTPRVTVNRVWAHYFGRGLVQTDEDFGSRGEPPSHPELLDYLASELIERDYRLKSLHKLIVMSATYRQSSRDREALREIDPRNTLLARQNRFRVSAEIVRDLHLKASGLLTLTVGGPSVRPPLPKGVAELGYNNSVKWKESEGPDRYRRGLYIFVQRTVIYPMLTTFDAPDSVVTCTRRERSNTPLQALTLLNDPVFFECAQALARRVILESPDAPRQERIRHAFRICLSRRATSSEVDRLEQLYEELHSACRENPDAAAKLAGEEPIDGIDAPGAAAWVGVARTILNLDEFVTRE